MSIDSNDFREALQPQDALAIVITVLGVAIAIFLPDSIVKLIGGSIAVLGGIAFYTTLRARINDRVQIRKKRTTLPPPSFKTNVSTDPRTSAKRIRFDDFQETFHVNDESEDKGMAEETHPAAGSKPSPPLPSTFQATMHFDDVGNNDFDSHDSYTTDVDEGFTIVGTQPASPVDARQEHRGKDQESRSRSTSVSRKRSVATLSSGTTSESQSNRGEKKRKKHGRKLQTNQDRTEESVSQKEKTRGGMKAGSDQAGARSGDPVPVGVGAEAPSRGQLQSAVRRQIRMVLDELSPDSDEESFGAEPRAEFVKLVNQVLKGIARSIDGRSILFFWMNLEKGHFIPEACVTRGDVKVRLGERIKLSNDLISQIARGGVPEIITDISPAAESELVPYYREKADTHSFVGVPVYFQAEVVGVLAVDSTEESGFDEGSVATLAEYTLLIGQLIRSYAEKFDLYLMRQSVEAFEQLHSSVTGGTRKPSEIATLLTEQSVTMFDSHFAAVLLYDKTKGEWHIASCHAVSREVQDHILSLLPDMHNSLASMAARRADEIYRPNVQNEMCIAPEEKIPDGGSFLALPLMASAKCYGSLALGHTSPGAWVARDIDLLRDLVRYVAMAIEVVNTNEALEEQLVFDEETGLYNTAFFMGGFDREIDRARDFKTPLSLALVRVETPQKFAPERKRELSHVSVLEVGNLLAKKLRPYDLLGRFSDNTFSVALVGRSDQEAYLWAERLRKEIAGHIIPFESRTLSVTVSAGVCNATDSSDKAHVINGARQALDKAAKDGGNTVVIY